MRKSANRGKHPPPPLTPVFIGLKSYLPEARSFVQKLDNDRDVTYMFKMYIILIMECDAQMGVSIGFLKFCTFEIGLLLYDKVSLIYNDILQISFSGRIPVKWTAIESLNYGVYTSQSDV